MIEPTSTPLPTPWRSRAVVNRRQQAPAALVLLLALLVAIAWWRQRCEWATALPTAIVLATLLVSSGWRKRHRARAITLAADIVLIFVYLWSLDDSIHFVIRGSGSTYIAQIGNNTAVLNRPVRGGRVGLYAGGLDSYRVQPTGEAMMPAATTPLARFGNFVRLAEPRPAWTNFHWHEIGSKHATSLLSMRQVQTMTGAWSINRRGELEGGPGSNAFVGSLPNGNFTLSADLMRGDGTQGIVVGVNAENQGYVFAARPDQPDAIWFDWSNGVPGNPLGGVVVHEPLLPMIQRTVRLFLGNAIAALLFIVLAPVVYVLFSAFLRLLGGTDQEDQAAMAVVSQRERLPDLLALLASLVAVVTTALIATQLLESIPHVQDDVAYLFQAKSLTLGRLWVPTPKLPTFFTEEFIPMYQGRWFSKYPPGWPLLLAVGVLAHLPWLVNPVLCGIDLLLIYLIGREVYGRGAALVATLLALSSPFLLFLGGSYMSHTSTLLYLSSFAYLLIRWIRHTDGGSYSAWDAWRLLLPAGFLLGMAGITRGLDAVAYSLPFGLLLLPRLSVRLLRAGGWLVLGAGVPVVGLLLYNWDLTGSPLTSPYSLWWPFDHLGFGPGVGYGHTVANGFWNLSYNLEMLLAHLFGWPFFFTLALALLPFLLGRANRWDAMFGASALCVMGAYVFYWHPGVMYGPRYYYVAIPWFTLLTGRGLEELYRLPPRLLGRWKRDRLAAAMVPASLAGMLLAYNVSVYLPTQIPIYRGYNFTSAAKIDTVNRAGLHHALVFVSSGQPGEWWSYGDVFSSNSPLLNGDVVYARDEGRQDQALMKLYPAWHYYRLNETTLTRLKQ